MKIRVVSATRLSASAFWEQSLLGRSLRDPAHAEVQHTIISNNRQGLPALYNQGLTSATDDVLIFCHDDLSLPPQPLEPTLHRGLARFDILGLAGNSRDQQHLAWHLHPDQLGWDFPYLRGEIRHGTPDAPAKDVYGLCNTPVSLIDGAWIALRPARLLEADVHFDERFRFHFYDLDLCRRARERGLSIGVVPLPCMHGSGGGFGSEAWQREARHFCQKWKQPAPLEPLPPRPTSVDVHVEPSAAFQQGRLAYRAGRYKEAIAAFERAVRERPQHGWSWLQLANSQRRHGDPRAAIASLRRLTETLPGFRDGWRNLALLLEQEGELEEARCAAERMLLAAPRDPEAIETLALLLLRQNAKEDAESLLRAATQALGREAQASRLWLQLARLLLSKGDSRRAYLALHNGSLLAGDDPEILLPKAALLLEAGQPEAALEGVEQVLAVHPEQLDALQRKAEILQFMGELELSLAVCRQGLALAPNRIELLLLQLYASQMLCAWEEREQQLEAIMRALEKRSAPEPGRAEEGVIPLSPFGLLTLPLPQPLIIQEIDRWVLPHCPAVAEPCSPLPAVHGERRPLRIGYLSADFRSHAMGLLLEGLFEAHDRDQAESFAYSTSPIHDALTTHFEATADHFHHLHGRSDAECLEQIRSDQLDVLLDLTGLTTFSRPALICNRAAPLQLGYLGFPGSQGHHYLDGLLADATLIPAELESDYSEAVWRLPHLFASPWRQPAAIPSRFSLGLPEEAVVYCCFNRAEKISPAIVATWCSILEEVPGSVLWLSVKPAAEQNLRQRLAASGLAPERLLVAPYLKPVEHFIAAMNCADLFLDTPGFNAGAIGVLALNAGLPLLTLAGERFTARMGASLCHATGLEELVMPDLENYQERAIELGHDRAALARFRSRLGTNPAELPLFNQRRWVRDLVEVLQNR